MELKDLAGEHILTGVDFENETIEKYCEAVNFILDNETYTAIQDPNDGYRSCMREIINSSLAKLSEK